MSRISGTTMLSHACFDIEEAGILPLPGLPRKCGTGNGGRWCRKCVAFKCGLLSLAFVQRKQPDSQMMSLSPGNAQPLHQRPLIRPLIVKYASIPAISGSFLQSSVHARLVQRKFLLFKALIRTKSSRKIPYPCQRDRYP